MKSPGTLSALFSQLIIHPLSPATPSPHTTRLPTLADHRQSGLTHQWATEVRG